jgi:YD repeat-containing protein
VPYQSEIASPCVYYGNVEVKSVGISGVQTGKTQYCFEIPAVCDIDYFGNEFLMENQFQVDDNQLEKDLQLLQTNNLTLRSTKIINNTSSIGRLLSMKVYNEYGHLISSTVNNYKPVDQIENGIVQETFLNFKGVVDWKENYTKNPTTFYMVSASRVNYPSILDNTVTTNSTGVSTVTFDKYDFKTGNVLEQTTTSSNGKTYQSLTIPAYQKYEEMGPSYDDPAKKNMLSQQAAAYNYVDGKLVNASIQTWSIEWTYRDFENGTYGNNTPYDVWRKHQTHVWKGAIDNDGSYKDFTDAKKFDFSNLSANAANGWVKTSEVKRYNHFSAPLEVADINDKSAATHYGYDNGYVIATGANVNYASFAHTGFESELVSGTAKDFGCEIIGNTTDHLRKKSNSTREAHTGDYYLEFSNADGPVFSRLTSGTFPLTKGRKYRISVWMHENSASTAQLKVSLTKSPNLLQNLTKNITDASNKEFGEWKLVSIDADIEAATTSIEVKVTNTASGNIYIDDMRIQPIDATVGAYTYDDAGNLTAIIDNNNFAVKYQYDDAGRLIGTYKETPSGFKRVSESIYNHKRSNYYVDFKWSDNPQMGSNITFTAQDAGGTYSWDFGDGTTETGRVAYHSYSSSTDVTYNVKLTIKDADGKTESLTKSIFVDYIPTTSEIEINKPQSGEILKRGNLYTIKWSGYTGAVNIIGQPDLTYETIASNVTGNQYSWLIPYTTPIGEYTILIISSSTNSIYKMVTFIIE